MAIMQSRICRPALSWTVVSVLVALALTVAAGSAHASKADELLSQADRAALKALQARSKTDRDESFKKALELYG
ncbi:MAG: hypothetical protein ACPL7K_05655, partial [Armatimonadota bacterium]